MKKKKIKLTILSVTLLMTTTFANAQWTQIGSNINREAIDDLSGSSISLSADGLTIA